MTREIIVNVGERETRIALIENSRLAELHIERGEHLVGSLFKARVENVLPGMDAAFVDIGIGRNAFLHVGDIIPGSGVDEAYEDGNGDQDDQPASMRESRRTLRRSQRRQQRIGDLLKKGQEIVVQVIKGPRGTKGARVSTLISLPGRYLVLMPEGDMVGVSRRITDRAERSRLRRIGERMRKPGFGIIMRTEAEDKAEWDLEADHAALMELWEQIQTSAKSAKAPALLHRELSLVSKTIRDMFGSDVSRLVIDDPEEYERIHEVLANVSPMLRQRIHLYTGSVPIFTEFGLEAEIERSLKRKVWLRSGGYLIIDVTEGLTVVDVNTGKFTTGASLADTILRTNLEAAAEIARQLRLRDIGGIIVIDFIDMSSPKDRQQVHHALEAALQNDKARTRIYPIGPLGLVEMTRKRTTEAVPDFLNEPCECCAGRGSMPSSETMAATVEREIMAAALDAGSRHDAIVVRCSLPVAEHLIGEDGEYADQLEQRTRKAVFIRGQKDMSVDRYEITTCSMLEAERVMPPLRHDQVVEGFVCESRLQPSGGAVAWSDGLLIVLNDGRSFLGQAVRICLRSVARSWATGSILNQRPAMTSARR